MATNLIYLAEFPSWFLEAGVLKDAAEILWNMR